MTTLVGYSLIILLSVIVLLLKKSKQYKKYGQIFYGLLILLVAVSLDWIIGIYLIKYLGIRDTTPSGWAFQKLNECVVIVSVVILLTKRSPTSLGSIFIQKGNLKQGLSIGVIAFILAAAGSIPMATLFNAKNLTLARIIPWLPWILIFVLANATMEEIMFRGLFLAQVGTILRKIYFESDGCHRVHCTTWSSYLHSRSIYFSCHPLSPGVGLGLCDPENGCCMGINTVSRRNGYPDHFRYLFK